MNIKDAHLGLAVRVINDCTTACGNFATGGTIYRIIGVDVRDDTVCVPKGATGVLWINDYNLKLYVMGSY